MRFIVPVKGLGRGKSRLLVPADLRADLVEAMLLDTMAAVLQADLGPVIVVSPDAALQRIAAAHGAVAMNHPGTLNEAIAAAVQPGANAAVLPDLPALRPGQLHDALAGNACGFVPDWSGKGTTMLFGRHLTPAFGAGSAQQHEQLGYPLIDLPLCGLRADVDTQADLVRADSLGLGVHTRRVMERLRADPAERIGP